MTHQQIFSLIIIAAAPLAGRTFPAEQPSVKLEILGGRPVASRVFLNGQGPFRFLLDTGAQTNQVKEALASKLGLAPSFQVEMDTRLGTTRARGGRVAEITLGNATAVNQEFLFTTMEAVHALSPNIQGVLGQEFLSRFDCLLDFRGRRLVFGATAPDGTRIPARVIDGRMAIQTSYGDLVLDSGTHALVLFHTPASSVPGGTIRTASGAGAVSMMRDATVRIGAKSYRPAMAVVAANPAAPEDGLLPASLFGSIFICNSAHYVIAEPRPEKGER
jgi:predicted aspartyl protease